MAHTSDGKVYYFHTVTKQTKWDLSEVEIESMMDTMKYSYTDKSGYAWKRAPRASDNDKVREERPPEQGSRVGEGEGE